MHSYCLISAPGTRNYRRVRAPHEMDQPPAFKTRRSNAVQSRRLALHVSRLEKHMAVMESERARAVRVLREELREMSTPRKAPKLSPRHARIMANVETKYLAEVNVKLPSLTVGEPTFGLEGQGQTKLSDLSQQNHLKPKGHTGSANKKSIVVTKSCPNVSDDSAMLLSQSIDKDSRKNVEENDAAAPYDTAFSSDVNQTQHQTGITHDSPRTVRRSGVYIRRSGSGNQDVNYAVGVPLKTGINQRSSKSLPPSGNSDDGQGQGHSQDPAATRTTTSQHPEATKADANQTQQSKDSEKLGHQVEANQQSTEVPTQQMQVCVIGCEAKVTTKQEDQSHYVQGNTPDVNHLDSIVSSTPELRPSSRSPYRSRHKTRSTQSPKHLCPLAGTPNHRCSLFPCMQPHTYHSLGFHPDTSIHPWPNWITRNACRPHHRLAPGRPLPPVGIDGRRTPADAASYMKRSKLGKEEVVKLDMARKKHLHALARPPSWNTNYGQPVPLKRVKNPVRLLPLE